MIVRGLWSILRRDDVKLLTVVILNQNRIRQDDPMAGVIGFCTGPNRVGPI
jgi:hypothetical protein